MTRFEQRESSRSAIVGVTAIALAVIGTSLIYGVFNGQREFLLLWSLIPLTLAGIWALLYFWPSKMSCKIDDTHLSRKTNRWINPCDESVLLNEIELLEIQSLPKQTRVQIRLRKGRQFEIPTACIGKSLDVFIDVLKRANKDLTIDDERKL